VKPTEPLPLFHSWPIFDADHFALGRVDDGVMPDQAGALLRAIDPSVLARHKLGRWECDLADDSLTWSRHVYDLFGLPHDTDLSRAAIVSQYCEHSRAAMERLRAYAIRHRRGFTLDAEILPISGARRWMRLVAAPICVEDRAVRLVGLKWDLADFLPT